MDKLTAMQAFVRVVEAGTFTKAADTLGMEMTPSIPSYLRRRT